MLNDILGWVGSLPPNALYAMLGVAAAVENLFPPAPADTVVAFGAFLAARGGASLAGVFLATWVGNVAGAVLTYVAGRRLGAPALHGRFRSLAEPAAQERVLRLYNQWGIAALFASRFIPAARAVVPPLAGALRIPATGTLLAITLASGVWYGVIAFVAYRVGSNWDELLEILTNVGRGSAAAGAAILLLVGVAIYWRRKRRRERLAAAAEADPEAGASHHGQPRAATPPSGEGASIDHQPRDG